jgi:hypothetical protein
LPNSVVVAFERKANIAVREGFAMSEDTITEEQRKVADEVDADLEKAFEAAQKRLTDAGFEFDPVDTGCRLCGCDGFRFGPGLRCKTPGCGHGILRHRQMD